MAQELQISDFGYELPEELIAQKPCDRREDARLLVVNRARQSISHHHVHDLPGLLQPHDVLVFNNSKVLPARLFGIRSKTGGKWEGLFLQSHGDSGCWEFMAHTRGYLEPGEWIDLLDRELKKTPHRLQVMGRTGNRHLLVKSPEAVAIKELLDEIGHVPLPQYIRKGIDDEIDRKRYQTVYATEPGSVAAPTAGLHFSDHLLTELAACQINLAYVTLHVGIGTFAPVKSEVLSKHVMHEEQWQIPEHASQAVNLRRGRCIAVGTTSMRTLESAALARGYQGGNDRIWFPPCSGTTSLFIQPGFAFQVTDGLLTNFHLPRTTLLILISAFAGRDLIMHAYEEAIQQRYRFFSYGDAMLIL